MSTREFVEIRAWMNTSEDNYFNWDNNSREEGIEFAEELYSRLAKWVGIDPKENNSVFIKLNYDIPVEDLLEEVKGIDDLIEHTDLSVTYSRRDDAFLAAAEKGALEAAKKYKEEIK